MNYFLIALAIVVVGQLRCSSAAGATLQLPSDVWENSTVQINCISDIVGYDASNLSEVRFWKESSSDVYFVYTKTCGTDVFELANDTTNGRIALTPNNTVLTWVNLTIQDSGSYKCSLVSCLAPNGEQASDSVPFTVHRYNTIPIMREPVTGSISGYLGDSVDVTFTCEGYTGYPPGTLRLSEKQIYAYSNSTYVGYEVEHYPNMTVDSQGNGKQTVTVRVTFQRLNNNYFECQTYKKVGNVTVYQLSSKKFDIKNNYPPEMHFRIRYTQNSSSNIYEETNYENGSTVYVNDPGTYLIQCIVYSDPFSDLTFIEVGKPSNYLKATSIYTYIFDNKNLDITRAFERQCTAEYTSEVLPARKVNITGYFNVYVNYLFTPTSATTPSAGNRLNGHGHLLMLAVALIFLIQPRKF